MKVNLILLIVTLLLVSCENENTTPKPTIYTYTYTGKHEIKDFNVYVGPKGEKIEMDEKLASNFWGEHSLLGRPYNDIMVIDTRKDSIYMRYSEIPSLETKLALHLSNDTLWVYGDDYFEYWGVFKDESTFIMNRAHYFINHDGQKVDGDEYLKYVGGHYGYWRYHEKARMNALFHENSSFKTLADMTSLTDTVALLTEYYEFKLTEKK